MARDCSLYWSLLLSLAHHWEDTVAEFESALRQRDAARLGLLAHKLKGVAGNLGATDLEHWAGRLERMANQPDSQATRECHAALRACLRDLSLGILKQPPDWPGLHLSHPPQLLSLDGQVQKLLIELDNCDGQALTTWSESTAQLQDRLSLQEIAELDQLIQDFDFDSAKAALRKKLI